MSLSVADADRALTAPGQTFEVTTADVRGVPTRVWANAPATLRHILEASAGFGDATFVVYEDEHLTFAEHRRAVARLATALVGRLGVGKGDRVAIAMRNYPDWSVAFWATASVGAVAVPLNAWWTGPELRYGLADSGAEVLICDQAREERLVDEWASLPDLQTVVVARPDGPVAPGHLLLAEVVDAVDPAAPLPALAIDPDDDATIFYTSGTTGSPKGALGTHRNICSNPMSLVYVTVRNATRAGREVGGGGAQSAMLLSVPLFHATGCHSILAVNLLTGGKIVMMHHWDAGRALELIERERITSFGGVPAMAMQVLDHPDFATRDTSSVASVSYGGAPAPPDLVRRIRDLFPGSAPSNGYGLTETSSVTSMNQGDDYVERPASVGPPVPVCQVRVVGPSGDEVPVGEVGELWITGPNIVKGYWHKPDATAAAISDGWLHSGDVARVDADGYIYIVDRAKDMLIRGGENIYCVEIESVLHDHPGVADAAIIGLPHEILGEEVGAVVQRRPGVPVDEAALQAFVGERLAKFKVPVKVWFVDQPLPRNPAGKILKRQLRDELTTAS